MNPAALVSLENLLTGHHPKGRLYLWILAGFMAMFYLWPAATLPLIDMDEGAYAAVSREMYFSGQWWTTMLNGEPFFHKPVLMYWLQSLGLALVGDGSLAYRLPSLIAFALWLRVTFTFVRRHLDVDTAWLTLWISLGSAGILVIFQAAIPDAWLILFISLGLYRGMDYLRDGQNQALLWAFIWTGLGILAKGPIALVVVAGSLFFVLLVQRNWPILVKMLSYWPGWLALMGIALPWYLLQVALYGQVFIDEFFGVHNVGRFLNPMEGHSGNPLYYVFALILLTLPFTPLLWGAFKGWWAWKQTSPVALLLGVWFLLVLVFFTLAATKLPHYLMYGIPPVIVAMASYLRHHQLSWGLGFTLLLTVLLMVFLPWIIEQSMTKETNPYLLATFAQPFDHLPRFYWWFLSLAALIALVVMVISTKASKIVLASSAMGLIIQGSLLPLVGNLQQQPLVEAAAFVREQKLSVVTCCIEMPSFNVLAQQSTPVRLAKAGEVVFGKTYELEARYGQIQWLWRGRGVAIGKVLADS